MVLCEIKRGQTTLFTSSNIIDGSLSLNRYTSNSTANVLGCVSSSELMFSIDKSTTQNVAEVGDRLYVMFYDKEDKEEDNFEGDGSRKTFSLSRQSMDLSVYLDGVFQRLLTDYSVTFTTIDNFTAYTDITFTTAPADGATVEIVYTPFPTNRTVGTFIVTKVEALQRSFSVTCLDPMIELDTVADLSGIAFPKTAMELLQTIETRSLMQIDYDHTLPNPSLNNPVFDSNVTWRQILSKVCECMGAVAYYDTALRVRGFETTTKAYTDSNYFSAELTGEAYGIDIEATNDATASTIALDGSNLILRIVGNEFLAGKTQTGLDNIADAIKQKIGTVEWYGGRAVILPEIPFVMPNQIVTIDGKAFPVMEVTHGINENIIVSSKVSADNIEYNNEPQKQLEKVKEQGRHFFYRDDSGIHITMVENDYNTGKNVLIDSDSMDFRDGERIIATFGEYTRIGEQGTGGIAFSSEETVFYDAQGSVAGRITQGTQEDKELEQYTVLGETFVQTQDGFEPSSFSLFKPLPYTPISDISVYLLCSTNYLSPALSQITVDVPLDGTAITQTLDINTVSQGTTLARLQITMRYSTLDSISGIKFEGSFTSVVSPSGSLPYLILANASYTYTGAVPMYLFGKGLQASQPYSFIVGQYNEDNYNLFAVGNGSDEINRSNIFEVDLSSATVNGVFSVINGLTSVGELWTDEIRASGVITAEQNIVFDSTNKALIGVDYSDYAYPLICDNGTNLWIGASKTATQHHAGRTYISSGYNTSLGEGYESIYVAVPNATNTGASTYRVYHEGNLNGTAPISVSNGVISISNATTTASGAMTATDKTKVNKLVYASGLSTANFGDSTNTDATYIWGNTSNKVGVGAYNNTDNKRYDLLARADHLALRNNTDDTIDWRLYPTSGTAPISVSNGVVSIANATTSASGAMSSADKTKIDKFAFATGITSVGFGDSSNTANVIIYGNATNKVNVATTLATDNKRYDLSARSNFLRLYNRTDDSVIWDLYPPTSEAGAHNGGTSIANKSVPTGSYTTLGSFDVTAGVYLVVMFVQFTANATGRRQIFMTTSSTGTSPTNVWNIDNQSAVDGATTTCRIVTVLSASSATTWYVRAYQNSGSSLTATTRFDVTRL